MRDTLTTGSDRLMTRILVAESKDSPVAAAIKADPGIVALVEAVAYANDVFILHGAHREELPGDMYVSYEKCNAALKKWETG